MKSLRDAGCEIDGKTEVLENSRLITKTDPYFLDGNFTILDSNELIGSSFSDTQNHLLE